MRQDPAWATAVAPAMMWHRDEFYRDVMYCVVKWLCIVVNIVDCHQLCQNLNCHSMFCSYLCLYILYHLFWRLPIREGSQNMAYIKKIQYIPRLTEKCMVLYSSVNQGYNGHVAAPQGGQYIHRFHITDKYTPIFLGTNEHKELYSSVLCSSMISSVNRGIYSIFLSSTAIFIGCNWQMFHSFLKCDAQVI
jgi:hypothetical protein